MGYLEALKAGLMAGKWLILLIAALAFLGGSYYKGVTDERQKWVLSNQARALAAIKTLQEATTKTLQETAKSNAYAAFIESEYNAKVDQIHNTTQQFHADRLHERAACTRVGVRALSSGRHPVLPAKTPLDDEAGFSVEFKQFLESQIRRDQLNTVWIEESVKAAHALCQQPNVTCTR